MVSGTRPAEVCVCATSYRYGSRVAVTGLYNSGYYLPCSVEWKAISGWKDNVAMRVNISGHPTENQRLGSEVRDNRDGVGGSLQGVF